MISRRMFVGSLAAFCSFSGISTRLFASKAKDNDRALNWRCDTIRTMQHNNRQRASIVTGVSIQPSGSQIAVVGDDHYVCIFDSAAGRFSNHLGTHTDWVRSAKFSPDGRILATAGNDRKLMIWDPENYSVEPTKHPHRFAVIDLAFSSNSQKIATVGFGQELKIFNIGTATAERSFQCQCADNHAVAFSSDDRLIAAGGRSGVIRVWDVQAGSMISQLKPHRQRIRSLQFTSAGEIVSCSDDQIVRISNPQNQQMRALPRHASKLFSVAMLGDDLLATSGSDNRIHIWQLSSSKKLGTLNGHTGTVSCLDVSGNKIASGAYDTEVRVWHFDPNFNPAFRETRKPAGQLR